MGTHGDNIPKLRFYPPPPPIDRIHSREPLHDIHFFYTSVTEESALTFSEMHKGKMANLRRSAQHPPVGLSQCEQASGLIRQCG